MTGPRKIKRSTCSVSSFGRFWPPRMLGPEGRLLELCGYKSGLQGSVVVCRVFTNDLRNFCLFY